MDMVAHDRMAQNRAKDVELAPVIETTEAPEKECVHCASTIPLKAIKCLKCGGYQNYRRYFDFSSTILALLIALISVASSALSNIPSLYGIINGKRDDLGVRTFISGISVKEIDLVYANDSGRRVWVENGAFCRIPQINPDAALFERGVRYPKANEVVAIYDFHFSSNSEEGFFIEPDEATVKNFKVSRVMRENGGWKPSSENLVPYCQTMYRDTYGAKGTYWLSLDKIATAHMALNLETLPLDKIDKTIGGVDFSQ